MLGGYSRKFGKIMGDGNTVEARWLPLIETQLREILTKLDRALDVAPALRFRLEGFTAAAHADGVALDELLQFCVRALPLPCTVRIDRDHRTLQFDFWQKRAPVV